MKSLHILVSLALFLTSTCVSPTHGWEDAELDVFDLVEEVNTNFYEYLELSSTATSGELRKAYRRLSLVLHPDKNPSPDAEVKFRWLVAIYEVLKDENKRAIYDRVLVEGLPNWRTPIFYYRRMRKMGLAEGVAYLAIIVTVCQFCINWAAYMERRFTLREAVHNQTRRLQKRVKKGESKVELEQLIADEVAHILGPKPTVFDTMPFQLYNLAKWSLISLPALPSTLYSMYKSRQMEKEEEARKEREEEEMRERREEEKRAKKERAKKRKQVDRYKDKTGEQNDSNDEDTGLKGEEQSSSVFNQPANALQLWTDDDLSKLAKLMKKYPVGTNERWERIADIMERLPWEVAKMARKVKDVSYQIPISKGTQGVTGMEESRLVSDDRLDDNEYNDDNEEGDDGDDSDYDSEEDDENYGVYSVASKDDYVPQEVKEKKKTKGGKLATSEPSLTPNEGADNKDNEDNNESSESADIWAQSQQRALESALAKFPKGTPERWDRIASKVEGKSKKQCMMRYKWVAEEVKKKKEAKAANDG